MREALAEAAAAATAGRQSEVRDGPEHLDVPVGAVILDPAGVVVARAHNRREADGDPTAHAEIVALRAAARVAGNCRLVYGAADPKAGAVGSLWDVLRDRRLGHRTEVLGGVLAEECAALLRDFFAERRRAGTVSRQGNSTGWVR